MVSIKKNNCTDADARTGTYLSEEQNLLACVIVTYHPDIQILAQLLKVIPASAVVVLVDNASAGSIVEAIHHIIVGRERIHFIVNDTNRGLAAAINQGIEQVKIHWPEASFVLLLDQDSEPLPGSIELLVQTMITLEGGSTPVGCVGPALLDPVTGLSHGFHQYTRWRWIRITPPLNCAKPIPCANLNGSGTLMSLNLFFELGGLDETLFIDHVDTEWSFRVRAAGYTLYGIPTAHFIHRMGENSRRIWLFGWRIWPMRTPQRHYFLFRNAMILMRRNYVPGVWKIWVVIKLTMTAVVHGLIDSQRVSQLRNMFSGLCDGMKLRCNPGKSCDLT